MIDELNIKGKTIYVFENHETALIPWAYISSKSDKPLYLITLDHHTDIHPAFLNYTYSIHKDSIRKGDREKCEELMSSLCQKIDKFDIETVREAVSKLKNDEHIDAAIQSNIISHSFSIQYADNTGTISIEQEKFFNILRDNPILKDNPPTPPFTYSVPKRKMFIVPHDCVVGCEKMPHDDDCTINHYNHAIEDSYLEDQLASVG